MATNTQKATPNYVDESVINYRVWHNTNAHNDYVGLAQIDLPTIENITQEVSGSMISGTPSIPVLGHIGDMSMGITFKSCNKKAGDLLTPGEHVITVVAAVQRKNVGSQELRPVKEKYLITVQPKSFNAGTLKPASLQETKLDFTVTKFIVMEYNDATRETEIVVDVDPLNFKYVVNGKDYLAEVREVLEVED